MNQIITVKTNTIKSQNDMVAIVATYNMIDGMIDRLERSAELNTLIEETIKSL